MHLKLSQRYSVILLERWNKFFFFFKVIDHNYYELVYKTMKNTELYWAWSVAEETMLRMLTNDYLSDISINKW